ncbi:hypothetical protein OSTOST_12283 [Ostertagia ostertagi]
MYGWNLSPIREQSLGCGYNHLHRSHQFVSVLVGLLSWWGADLDPVTQVDVLLATGFSVDYTAHVAYQFYRSHGSAQEELTERLTNSLREMAAPMVQGWPIHVPVYAATNFRAHIRNQRFCKDNLHRCGHRSYTWTIRPTGAAVPFSTINATSVCHYRGKFEQQ